MKNTYYKLIEQSFKFPQEGFKVEDNFLTFHGVSLKNLIEKYGTPFRLFYLPNIGEKINSAKKYLTKPYQSITTKELTTIATAPNPIIFHMWLMLRLMKMFT